MMAQERRTRKRFRIPLPMKYTGTGSQGCIHGTGTVVNIGSQGFAFHAEPLPFRGMDLTASLSWPTLLNHECTLQLTVEGRVIRVERGLAVMRIHRYEFRTLGKADAVSNQELVSAARNLEALLAHATTAQKSLH
ncbi:MAG TPA: PilZ domain-containing protein [Bryobacteraceae bacterium]|nr:PilZ domain-containing protein [Bryobacteraceae bacterium]